MEYKDTLNLPKTGFQMKASLPKKEPETLKAWDEQDLYAKIVEAGAGRERYILHDGPPYANGHIHIGHALNKILKDIVVKSRSMTGRATKYVPGWDCHGLPIELHVEKELKKKRLPLDKGAVRRRCREYAAEYVDIQREEFKRLGVFGDWDNPYLTMDYSYQAAILRELKKFVESGIVYRGKKPVHWCSSCRTALAEAEVEYADKTSPSIYVKFRVVNPQGRFKPDDTKGTYFVIWTTTPWTMPANLAIALHPELVYRIVRTPAGDLILCEELIETCMEKFGFAENGYEVAERTYTGAELEGVLCAHPFIERTSTVYTGEYVTTEAGTGCVHIAPGHGQDDYELGLRHGLDAYNPVDDSGRFTSEVPGFEGQYVFKANAGIIELLKNKGALLFTEDIQHSYPHCWRCKGPIIFRATAQWFASMEAAGLRTRALKAIDDEVEWIPSWGKERIHSMIENRPDWCLSRQRAWGVPIPALRCTGCSESFLDPGVIERLAGVVEEKGADVWFTDHEAGLIPEGLACPGCGGRDFEREGDILDVWFDSGVSFAAVLERRSGLGFPAELYLEGSDQHRGWFHSSLLTSIGTRGRAPYRAVLTHGFVVDGNGRKMSKSTGNVVSPGSVVEKYGAEVLRLWVAAQDYREDIRISEEILKRLSEAYRRIRNTLRYILGNLYDFDPAEDAIGYDALEDIDRLTLHRLALLTARVRGAYERFEFHTIYHAVHNFCSVDLSAFYLDVLKDRLYTSAPQSRSRRAAQTTIYHVIDHLIRLTAPILVFTSDEAWSFMPGGKEASVHLEQMPEAKQEWIDEGLAKKWERLLALKAEISKGLEKARQEARIIGHSLEAGVRVFASVDAGFMRENRRELEEVLIVSSLTIAGDGEMPGDAAGGECRYDSDGFGAVLVAKAEGSRCERCWHWSATVGLDKDHPAVCARCVEALR